MFSYHSFRSLLLSSFSLFKPLLFALISTTMHLFTIDTRPQLNDSVECTARFPSGRELTWPLRWPPDQFFQQYDVFIALYLVLRQKKVVYISRLPLYLPLKTATRSLTKNLSPLPLNCTPKSAELLSINHTRIKYNLIEEQNR